MKAGIRSKMIAILVLAAALPLLVAIAAIQTVGYRQRVQEKGNTYYAEALLVADNLLAVGVNQVSALRDFLWQGGLAGEMEGTSAELAALPTAQLSNQVERLESSWRPDQPEVQGLLANDVSRILREFQQQHPAFAEILVADAAGRLAGATGMTTDYYQADETWWQRGIGLRMGEAWLEGFDVDRSSGVFSWDVALPVRRRGAPDSAPLGVVKAVLDAREIFSSIPLPDELPEDRPIREVVRSDGRIYLRLLDETFEPRSDSISEAAARELRRPEATWFEAPMEAGSTHLHMAGHAPLELVGLLEADGRVKGPGLLHVVVHRETRELLAPLRKQVMLLTILAFAGVLVCAVAGLYVAQLKLVRPLETLRGAAHALAATVQQAPSVHGNEGAGSKRRHSEALLEQLSHIQTGDEIEALSADFRRMGTQILHYQGHLKEEIAAKTEEIQHDLEMAREFQEALLPAAFPQVPAPGVVAPLFLRFHHAYRPTFTVSGDFFDVIKLSDTQVGLLIADVMGHGSRSALVTAIVRTLSRELVGQSANPAEFMRQLNEHFYGVIAQTRQTVFVTALMVVADTRGGDLAVASAGHPSPLILHRSSGEVEAVFTGLARNPALGLFPKAEYSLFRHPLKPGDVVLLLTDGVLEAPGEVETQEFGPERLAEVLRRNRDRPLREIIEAIVEAVDAFAVHRPLPDDVCLLGMEAVSSASAPGAVVKEPGAGGWAWEA